jgi:uncharacterized protein YkwD
VRLLAAVSAASVLGVLSIPDAPAVLQKPVRSHAGAHARATLAPKRRTAPSARLGALEVDIVARVNAQREARGLRPLRVSWRLTKAANYHTRQMGTLGFFEHESRNGAPFWRRIGRFYPAGRGYWSVGENILWETPETSASSAVHEWMMSAPHRENILTGEFRDVGVAAVHFDSAPGAFGGRPVTIVTADFGVRR